VVIGEIAIAIQPVLRHELDDLKGALLAIDIRNVDIRFIRRRGGSRAGVMGPETINQNWGANRVLNDRRYGLRPAGGFPGRHFRILWEL
jgi:hypothetical protein